MSVINKMLNDLNERKDSEQAQEEVAFMTPVAKPKRKWLALLVSSIVLGLTAVWGTYYFYADLLALAGVKTTKPPKILTAEEMEARIAAMESKQQASNAQEQKEPETEQTAKTNEPELIILKPKADDGKPLERPSTLTVVSLDKNAKPATGPELKQKQPSQTVPQTEQPLLAQADTGQNQVSTEVDATSKAQPQLSVTASDKPKITGAPKASKDKMQVSKVRLSPAKRAKKEFEQGKELSKNGLIVEAIIKYQKALQFLPGHQEARSELAALYYGRNEALKALEVLDDGLELAPDNLGWSLLAAKIHYKRTNYSAALAYLQLPVETYDHIEYVALKATTAYKLKAFDDARKAYQQLTIADPGNGRWWLGLGTTFEALGLDIDAVRAYRKSLRLSNISSSSRQFVMSRLQRLAN